MELLQFDSAKIGHGYVLHGICFFLMFDDYINEYLEKNAFVITFPVSD